MKPQPSLFLRRAALILCIAAAPPATSTFAQTKPATETRHRADLCTPAPNPFTQAAPPTHPPLLSCPAKQHTDTSISLGIFPQLTIGRTQEFSNGFSAQSTAPSTGTLGTFRQTFSPWLGYSVNLGYSRISEQYLNGSITGIYGGFDSYKADTNMYETSITYIAHTHVNKRISLFGDVGPGLLTFLPVHRGADAIAYAPDPSDSRSLSVQVRPTGVFGSGIDLPLSRHFDLRAEYRGLLYKNPDFQTGDYLSKLLTVTNETTVSLAYHFHATNPAPAQHKNARHQDGLSH